MRRKSKLHCTQEILSAFQLFPLDYFCKRYCVFQEDAIMTQQTTPKMKSIVALTTLCVIAALLCCQLPQADSLGSECYTITGHDYRGTQDRIELEPDGAGELITSTACLPWHASEQFNKSGARERGIGNHSYCRNPDNDILPWCKVGAVKGAEGAWGYCHLPGCQVPGYLGCFPDRTEPTALDGTSIIHKSMTVGSCLTFCRRQGYKYAGLEAGHACYCGNYGYGRYGGSSDRGTNCHLKCFGNKGQPCGGDGYVDVYKANIGTCGTKSPLETPSGAVYSPGYPDAPASEWMMKSLSAADVMMQKLKDEIAKREGLTREVDTSTSSDLPIAPEDSCEWKVEVKEATEINTIIKKIDPKGKLGGVIEIEAEKGSMVYITVPTNMTSSNVTSSPSSYKKVTIKSPKVWVTDSKTSRNGLDVVIPSGNTENGNTVISGENPQWSQKLAEEQWARYVIPSKSLRPMLSIKGGAFTVRFIRSAELMTSLRTAFAAQRSKSSRRKTKNPEWSRYVIEYEATFSNGMTYEVIDDAVVPDDVKISRKNSNTGNTRRNRLNRGKRPRTHNNKGKTKSKNTITAEVALDQTRFMISREDATAIREAIAGSDDANWDQGSNSPIKIEVIVEPRPGDTSASERTPEGKSGMSEFTIPLVLAVLLTTTAILILSAVLVIFRRGGISNKKNEKATPDFTGGLVVSCPRNSDRDKSGSNSNLSSSSTENSVLPSDSENSKYSPRLPRSNSSPGSPTIEDLMEFLKNQPGLIQTPPPVEPDPYKQISQNQVFYGISAEGARNDLRHDDVTPLPGPCPHCCGCAEDNRAHRHGDSCRAHHNQGKYGKSHQSSSASRSSGSKNSRGLSLRSCKGNIVAQQALPAPPLSPISEVSSVTSSMMSLPITSSNSQTSLLKQTPKTTPHKLPKKEFKETSPETEAFLAQDSDAESGIGDSAQSKKSELSPYKAPKLRFSDHVGEKTLPARYLGGAAGACYDSGYATSNYEEDEDKSRNDVIKRDNKNHSMMRNENDVTKS